MNLNNLVFLAVIHTVIRYKSNGKEENGKEEKWRKGALTAMLLSNLNQKLESKIDFEVALGGS